MSTTSVHAPERGAGRVKAIAYPAVPEHQSVVDRRRLGDFSPV